MGRKAATSNHLVNNSAVGVPAYPPTSAPLNAKPLSPRFSSIGVVRRRWFQVLLLSPVHVAAYRCPPAYVALVKTKGRALGSRFLRPSNVACEFSIPYTS